MAKPQIVIKEEGSDKAALHLHELGLRASDARKAAPAIKRVFSKAERRRFDAQGPGWPPLADSTRERKAAQGLPDKTMQATKALYRSLASERGGNQIDQRRPTEFEFGTSLPYAIYHETGKGVPVRELIDLTPAERAEIDKVLERYIARGKK